MFESVVLRKTVGVGDWRELHNKELNVLYPHEILLSGQIENNTMGRIGGTCRERTGA
jgi:hypothetical protein